MRSIKLTVMLFVFLLLGCGDNNEGKAGGDHVWKEQTDTIDKAKEVEDMLLKSAEEKARSIDAQTQ